MMNSSCQQLIESDDMFDRLPDEIVRSVFNKLLDAKSLCSSMAVCKRFHSIAPQVDHIYLPVPHKKAAVKELDRETTHKSFFRNVVVKTLMKPLHFISQMIKSKSKNDDDLDLCSYHIPNEVLKPFEEIRGLHLRLPCHGNQKSGSKLGGNGKNLTTFLKWKAEFGRELHSCVMLGANSRSKKPDYDAKKHELGHESVLMSEEDLKLRIVWTISCLIAASARHYLIKETVKLQKMIQNVVVSDESDQGVLCMNKEQIDEVKGVKGKGDEVLEYRSRVPALRMKMWYLERLELPDSGEVLEGATLVVIQPAGGEGEEVKGRRDEDLVGATSFGEDVLGEAARKLMVAKRCYTLEMNSF